MAKLRIRYTKSAIGYSSRQKDTIRSLGLGKLQSVVIHDDTPSIRGMAFHVRHLVTVEEIDESQIEQPRKRPATTIVIKASEQPEPEATRPTAVTKDTMVLTEPVVAEAVAPVTPVEVPTSVVQETVKLEEPVQASTSVVHAAADLNVASAEADVPAAVLSSSEHDLEIIEGIGPKIADTLRNRGITTFTQLAEAEPATLEQILRDAKLYGGIASVSTWAEQAALAAAGQWDELKSLQESLNAGRESEGETK